MHANIDKIGFSANSRTRFLLGSYNVAYKVCFKSYNMFTMFTTALI